MQNQNTVLYFQKYDQKIKTPCTNSEVYQKIIFFNKKYNFI